VIVPLTTHLPPPLRLPAPFGSQGFALRRARSADRAFERRLFESARTDAAVLAGWPAAMRTAFLDRQFQFQTAGYARAYPAAERSIVTARQSAIGRLILDRSIDPWQIVDIALLRSWRGRGIGGMLLSAVLEAAGATGIAVALTVEIGNAAQRLYERLGFEVTGTEPPYHAMLWQTSAAAPQVAEQQEPRDQLKIA
jgi:ribosomal protein S18 acetylase RimI-like enzyme